MRENYIAYLDSRLGTDQPPAPQYAPTLTDDDQDGEYQDLSDEVQNGLITTIGDLPDDMLDMLCTFANGDADDEIDGDVLNTSLATMTPEQRMVGKLAAQQHPFVAQWLAAEKNKRAAGGSFNPNPATLSGLTEGQRTGMRQGFSRMTQSQLAFCLMCHKATLDSRNKDDWQYFETMRDSLRDDPQKFGALYLCAEGNPYAGQALRSEIKRRGIYAR